MKMRHIRMLCISLLMTVMLLKSGVAAVAQATGPPVPMNLPIAFQGTIEVRMTGTRQKEQKTVTYSHGKWRIETRYSVPEKSGKGDTVNKIYTIIELYDGSIPTVIWQYYLPARTAIATLETYEHILAEAVRKEGDKQVRLKYGIPSNISLDYLVYPQWREFFLSVSQLYPELKATGKTVLIAGQACEERVFSNQNRDGSRSRDYVLIEPHSGLILMRETKITPGGRSVLPPIVSGFRFLNFKILSPPPIIRFQLPSGSKAIVPRSMAQIALPVGVTRVARQGASALTGINFGPEILPTKSSKP